MSPEKPNFDEMSDEEVLDAVDAETRETEKEAEPGGKVLHHPVLLDKLAEKILDKITEKGETPPQTKEELVEALDRYLEKDAKELADEARAAQRDQK